MLLGLTIDNGGSQLRGEPIGHASSNELFQLPNNFVTIEQNGFRIRDVEDPLMLCHFISAPKKEYQGIIATGNTGSSYCGNTMVLDNTQPKTSNVNYYRQFLFLVAYDAMREKIAREGVAVAHPSNEEEKKKALFSFAKKKSDNVHVNHAKIESFEYVIGTCIPIKEHSGTKDCSRKLKESIAGTYTVIFPLIPNDNKITFIIQKDRIGVLPEGGVAIGAIANQIDSEDYTLFSDLGYVTHDLALFKGKSLVGRVESSPKASSILEANVMNTLDAEGCAVSKDKMEHVMITGLTKKGKRDEDVSRHIVVEKKDYAQNTIKDDVLKFLRLHSLVPQQIQNFVPIGASYNAGRTTGDMIQYVVASCGLEDANVFKLTDDLRLVNIKQTSVYTKALYKRALKESESNDSSAVS